jgi:hypothetical protein
MEAACSTMALVRCLDCGFKLRSTDQSLLLGRYPWRHSPSVIYSNNEPAHSMILATDVKPRKDNGNLLDAADRCSYSHASCSRQQRVQLVALASNAGAGRGDELCSIRRGGM